MLYQLSLGQFYLILRPKPLIFSLWKTIQIRMLLQEARVNVLLVVQ